MIHRRTKPERLLLYALTFHVALTITICLFGRFGLLPGVFDANGIGTAFAIDCVGYREEAKDLVSILSRDGIIAWFTAPYQFHVKLYSLSFALFHPLFGFTVLSVEPLNLLYYLAVLTLVFKIGEELFDRRVGILAAGIVALWPSFLLHTTQLLRDPIFIVCMLVLVLVSLRWITRICSWKKGLVTGAAGGIICAVLLLIRGQMWEVALAIVLLSLGFLLIRQYREKRLLPGNLVGAALMIALVIFAPRVLVRSAPDFREVREIRTAATKLQGEEGKLQGEEGKAAESSWLSRHSIGLISDFRGRIAYAREGCITSYPTAGSNIDVDVHFYSVIDVARYLPRATLIGFFAPFPDRWTSAGTQTGLAGRLLAGLETAMMYLIELLAFFGLWRKRRNLTPWLLLLISITGLLALGMVVVNLGALYRMRYVFWMLLIILGAEGLTLFFPRGFLKQKSQNISAE